MAPLTLGGVAILLWRVFTQLGVGQRLAAGSRAASGPGSGHHAPAGVSTHIPRTMHGALGPPSPWACSIGVRVCVCVCVFDGQTFY